MNTAWTTTKGRLWLIQGDEQIYLGGTVGVDEVDIDRGLTIRALMPCSKHLLNAQNGCRFEIHETTCDPPMNYWQDDIMMTFSNCRFMKRIIPVAIAMSVFDAERMDIFIEVDADVEVRTE